MSRSEERSLTERIADRLFVDLPSVRAMVATIRGLPGDRTDPSEAGRVLNAAGLTAVIRVDGVEVARLGTDLKGIKYGHLALRPVGLLRALVG